MAHPRIYELLKRCGFSPAKASEVILDGRRGDRHAIFFVRFCRRMQFDA